MLTTKRTPDCVKSQLTRQLPKLDLGVDAELLTPVSHDPPRYAAAVPEGRRAQARGRSPARRPRHGRRSPVSLSHPLRGSRDLSNDRVAQAWSGRVGGRRSGELGDQADPPPAVQDFRDARARCHRVAARGLLQPGVPQGRLPRAPAGHPVRQARGDVARAADAEPAGPDPAAGSGRRRRARTARRRHAPHRAHRPDLREDRDADAEDAARDRAPGAVAAARRRPGSAAGRGPQAPAADRPPRRADGRPLSSGGNGRRASSTGFARRRSGG